MTVVKKITHFTLCCAISAVVEATLEEMVAPPAERMRPLPLPPVLADTDLGMLSVRPLRPPFVLDTISEWPNSPKDALSRNPAGMPQFLRTSTLLFAGWV